jgi:hypothetical protein
MKAPWCRLPASTKFLEEYNKQYEKPKSKTKKN